jgi:hypothetical protein
MRRDIYSVRLRLYGEEHEMTLTAANNYAASLLDLRKLAAPACPVASQPVNYVGENEKVRNPSTGEKPALPKVPRKGAAVFVVNLWEKEVQVDGEPYPALKDWNYDDFCAEPNYLQKPATDCSRHFGYLAQAYLAVRVNHLSNNWGDKVENCKLSFRELYKLAPTSNVKADSAKVRGARGPNYVYKAESLAVELSGSSDDDN